MQSADNRCTLPGQDAFGSFHPAVNFLYFAVLLTFSMFTMHPVCLGISLFCALLYCVVLKGKKVFRLLKGLFPVFLLTVIINPAFSHGGESVLCYLPSGNPVTLESILYGLAAGVMLCAVMLWFSCLSEVITSDKLVYLFGRIIPSLSLLLSMSLRFVPLFLNRFDMVRRAQRFLGRDTYDGRLLTRIKNAVACFSIVVTWSMENAIEVSDSMKSRGYGTCRRTAYSIYRWEERDRNALLFLALCGIVLISGLLSGDLYWQYFPVIRGRLAKPMTIFLEMVFLALGCMPAVLDLREMKLWKC